MAYQADILVKVQTSGEQRLNAVKASVQELNRLAQDLKPLNLLAPGGGKLGENIRLALKPIKDFARDATNETAKFSNTLAGATGQAQVFQTVLENVKLAAGGYSAQVAEVKNFANAFAQATTQADTYGKRLTTIQNDAIRLSKNYQTQTEREIQLSQRQIRLLELRTQKQRAADLTQRASTGAQNALIGGAFPLLFGQGPAAAIGGGLGGLAGGLLGGQFGFALSLIGTALGDAVQKSEDFDRSINRLNGSLNSSSAALRITAGDVEALAKQLSVSNEEAVDLLSTFSAFDDPAAIQELARAFADVGGVATAETLASIKDEKTFVEAIDKLRGQIGNKLTTQLLKQVELEGSQSASAALLDALLQKQEKITDETQRTVTVWDRLLSAFALSSGAPGINPEELSPEAIAGERAEAVPDIDKTVVEQYLTNLERIYKERDRLIKKYTPEREKSNKSALAEAEREARLIRQLDAELASSTKLLGIEKDLAAAKIEGNQIKVKELEVDKLLEESAGRVAEIKARGLGQAEEIRRIKLEENRLEENLLDIDTERALERKKLEDSFNNTLAGLEFELSYAKAITREEQNALELAQKRAELLSKGYSNEQIKQILDLTTALQDAQAPLQAYITETQRWLNDTDSMIVSLSQSITSSVSTAFTSAVTGIVDGSKTAGEALSDMFASIGEAFVSMAADIIAQQLMMIALQQVLQALGLATSAASTASAPAPNLQSGADFNLPGTISTGMVTAAEGTYVTSPTTALIGEGGGDEYVVPGSKMDGAMQRWNQGMRGDSVVSGAEPTGGAGGVALAAAPTNIVVEGGVLNFNDSQYIRQDQVPSIVKQASAAGEAMALRKLQMSTATRRRLGL